MRLLSSGVLFLGVGLCGYSLYAPVSGNFFLASTGVLMLGAILHLISRKHHVQPRDMRLAYGFIAVGFFSVLILGLGMKNIISAKVALLIASGLFLFIVIAGTSNLLRKLRKVRQGTPEPGSMNPFWYYLSLIGVGAACVIVFGRIALYLLLER